MYFKKGTHFLGILGRDHGGVLKGDPEYSKLFEKI